MKIIKLAPQLRNNPGFSNIYVNPDRTKEEREQGKKLRQELATRRENGEENLVIRRGKIIPLTGHPAGAAPSRGLVGPGSPLPADVGNRREQADGDTENRRVPANNGAENRRVPADSGAGGRRVLADGETAATDGDRPTQQI